MKHYIIILSLFFSTLVIYGQDSITKIKVTVARHTCCNPKIKYSDTLNIILMWGFNRESILIKDGNTSYKKDSLKSDVMGISGYIDIPKRKGQQRLIFYLNNNKIGSIRLRKKYSRLNIYLHREKHRLEIEYRIWRQLFL